MIFIKTYEKDKFIVIENVEDFNLEQTLECGQCFHFEKISDLEYGVVSMDKFIHIRQENTILYCMQTTLQEVNEYWIKYFDLDRDYAVIKKHLVENDERLRPAIEEKYGVRILNQEFEETLISFIISQNKQIPHIKQIVRNISEKYGIFLGSVGNQKFYSFPNIETLGKISEEEYKDMKTGFRAGYLRDASEKLFNNTINKKMFIEKQAEEAKEILMSIKGVGEKVANCVMLFGLGYRNSFPVDVWIKRIMEEMYFEGQDVKKDIIRDYAIKNFGEYGGYAQQYLFYYGREKNIGK